MMCMSHPSFNGVFFCFWGFFCELGNFHLRSLHSLNVINRKDNCTPYGTFEDNNTLHLIHHTIQYFVA